MLATAVSTSRAINETAINVTSHSSTGTSADGAVQL